VPKHAARKQQIESRPEILKGWPQTVPFLDEPISAVHRWANEGMGVRRDGRLVATAQEEPDDRLGKQSVKLVRVATENADLTAES
jgi:hypothetical protein